MKERPILFTGPNVLRILAGTKTQTRRPVRRQPRGNHYFQSMWGTSPGPNPVSFGEVGLYREVGPDYPDDDSDNIRCPYGVPGDQLWVRETWTALGEFDDESRWWHEVARVFRGPKFVEYLNYKADDALVHRALTSDDARFPWESRQSTWHPSEDPELFDRRKWQPSIFMPRWASRVQLEVTRVRVERLKDLTEEDALAEGIEPPPERYPSWGMGGGTDAEARAQDDWIRKYGRTPLQTAYFNSWDKLNPGYPSSSNPWVWAITFRRLS